MSMAGDIFVGLLIPLPATYIDAGLCLDPITELAAGKEIRRVVYIEEVPYPLVLETHVDWYIENTLKKE